VIIKGCTNVHCGSPTKFEYRFEKSNINYEELSIVISGFPEIHPNEIVAWKYLLENGQAIVDRTL
jgi:hypothetical protein